MAVSGHYAYVVAGDFPQVVDVSDPAHPQRVAIYADISVWDVALSGHYAYITGGWPEGTAWKSALRVLDVSDPANPRLVGKCHNGDDTAIRVAVSGDYAYVTGICWESGAGYDSLQVFDVANAAEPKRVGLCRTGGHPATHVAVSGPYAYLACGEEGLQVIDVSNPANPQRLGSWSSGGSANWVAVSGNRAFVGESAVSYGINDLRGGGLQIIDVSDSTNPQWVGACNLGEYTRCVAVSGDRAYVGTAHAGLRVVDIADPANPHQLGICDTQGARGIAISGDYAYVADDGAGLLVIDVRDPVAPKRIANCPTYESAEGVAVSGDRAYVVEEVQAASGWVRRLRVLEVSNPASPKHVGDYDLSEYGLPVSLHFTYVPHPEETWLVNDLRDPANPRFVGGYKTIASASDVLVSGYHAYALGNSQVGSNVVYGFQVIDISDPTQPRCVSTYYGVKNIGWGGGAALFGEYAYLASPGEPEEGGLLIVNVSDPTAPQQVAACNPAGGYTRDVAVSGQYAYLTDYDNGLQVLDLSNPIQPRLVASVPIVGAWNVTVSGRRAFVGDSFCASALHSLHIVDITDPANPVYAGRYPIVVRGAARSGNYVYVANGVAGVKVLDISGPATPQRWGAYALNGWIGGLDVSGDYAYLTESGWWDGANDQSGGLRVLDVSNPAAPRCVGAVDIPGFGSDGWPVSLAISDNFAVLAADNFQVFDISSPLSPRQVGLYDAADRFGAVVISGDYTYTFARQPNDTTYHLQVLDLSDPFHPQQVGEYPLGFEPSWNHVRVAGDYAYAVGERPSNVRGCLQAINISEPASPQGMGQFDYELIIDHCYGVALSGDYACLAAGYAGLLIVDLAEPAHPRLVGSYTQHQVQGVAVSGRYAYIAVSPWRSVFRQPSRDVGDYSGCGVEVIDISNPSKPRRVGGNSAAVFGEWASNVVVAGGRLYVTFGPNFEIMDLYQPPEIEPLRLDAAGFHLLVRGVTGQMLRLERSRNLLDWETVATVPMPASGQTLIDAAATLEALLFYRMVEE